MAAKKKLAAPTAPEGIVDKAVQAVNDARKNTEARAKELAELLK